MALTDIEKLVARSATYFGPRVACIAHGWTPDGLVALLRGATPFCYDGEHFTFTAMHNGEPWAGKDLDIHVQAMDDCAAWANFSTRMEYLDAVQTQGIAVFPKD